MATVTEKLIGGLTVEVATLREQLVSVRGQIEALADVPTRLAIAERDAAESKVESHGRNDLARRVGVIEQAVADLQKANDRRWTFSMNLTVALVGVLGVLLGVFLAAVLNQAR